MVEYSGRTSLHIHKFEDWQNKPIPENALKGIRKDWVLDAQWSTCPARS